MAHIRDIDIKCYSIGCESRATKEVYNRYNASIGQYCGRHAKQKLREQDRLEKDNG